MATGETNDGFKWPAHTDVAHAALYMEYWYFNFTDLDTGKGGIIGFGVVNPGNVLGLGTAAVTGAVFDGKGGGSSFMDIVRIEDFSAHTERAEVRVGDSGRLDQPAADEVLVRATDPKGRIAIDLRFHEAFQPVLETVDARGKRPWEWNSWLIYMPSAKVTGTITVDGQTTTITNGGGYHDHSWGAWLLPASTWAWAVWSDPGNQHAGVIGYHCAFEESQAFVVLPDGNGGEYRIEFDESTMVFTPKATRRWRLRGSGAGQSRSRCRGTACGGAAADDRGTCRRV